MAMSRAASAREATGAPVLHLEVGQPASGAPATSVEAVRSALGRPLGYTNAAGLHTLRHRIARHYAERYAVEVDVDRVLVVGGASAGFTLAFLASFEPGARVAVVEPGYPCYRNTLLALDLVPVPIVVGPAERWAPTADLLDAAGPIDGLVVASPSNPTGTVLSPSKLRELGEYCRRHGIRLIADEIYHGITYGEPAATALSPDTAAACDPIVVNSFSKYYSMTGWRVGWMVVPPELADAVERLQQNLYICAGHVAQVAALAAFDASAELDAHVERYAENRALLLHGLAAAGIDRTAEADGAFYVYADVTHLTDDLGNSSGGPIDSTRLCQRWLDELGVACTPGIDFDLGRGHRFVRFSYAGGRDDIERACELLAGWSP